MKYAHTACLAVLLGPHGPFWPLVDLSRFMT